MLYHYLVSLILPSRVESTNTANDDSGSRYESSGIVASQSYGGARPKVFGTPKYYLQYLIVYYFFLGFNKFFLL